MAPLFQALSTCLAPIPKLSRLTLYECNNGLDFISDLGETSGNEPFFFEHLSIQGKRSELYYLECNASTKACIERIMTCKTLRSLHLSWTPGSFFGDLVEYHIAKAKYLSSLSLHEDKDEGILLSPATFPTEGLRSKFATLLNLRAFGFELCETSLPPIHWSSDKQVLQFIVSEMRIRQLVITLANMN